MRSCLAFRLKSDFGGLREQSSQSSKETEVKNGYKKSKILAIHSRKKRGTGNGILVMP